jgi:hypothetical protein
MATRKKRKVSKYKGRINPFAGPITNPALIKLMNAHPYRAPETFGLPYRTIKKKRLKIKYNVVFIPMRVAEFARDNQLPSPEKRNRGYSVKLDHFIVPARTSKSARKKALKHADVYKVVSAKKVKRSKHKSTR